MFKRIVKNSGSSIAVLVTKIGLTLIMTPILLKALGNYDYGIWEILVSIIGYMGLLDIGMKPTITRHAAKYIGEGSREKLDELFATTCLFMTGIGSFLCIVFVIWALFGASVLSETSDNTETRYLYLLVIIGCRLLITFPGYVAEGFIFGFQKYAVNNLVLILSTLTSTAILYIYINENNALVLLALMNASGTVFRYIFLFIYLLYKKECQIKFRFPSASIKMLIHLIKFGSKSLIQGLGSTVESNSSLLLIGWISGPAVVVFYAIPASLARYLRTAAWAATASFMPLFSDLHGANSKEKIKQLYLQYSRYCIAVLFPLGVCVYQLGDDFIALWVGKEYIENSGLLLPVLVIYFLLPFINPFASRYLVAVDKHGLLAISNPIVAATNIILSIILINLYGVIGAAFGALMPICVSVPIILRFVCKDLGISVSGYLKQCLLPAFIPSVVLMSVLNLFEAYYEITSYLILIIEGMVGFTIYVWIFYLFVLTLYERNKLKRVVMKRLAISGS